MGIRRHSLARCWLALALAILACSPTTPTTDAGQTPAARVVHAQPKRKPGTPHPAPTIDWRKQPVKLGSLLRAPVIPVSWTVPSWFVDPVSGSDGFSCTDSSHACKHFAEIASRWGTYSPLLAQVTSITFLSDQPDATDPVVLRPYISDPGTLNLSGTLRTITWGFATFSTVTAATALVPLQIDLRQAASPAVGLLLDNTTHASREWVDSAASNVATVTNPFVKAVVPTIPTTMPINSLAVAGTTSGDSFTVRQPSQVYLVDFEPTVMVGPSSFAGPPCTITDIWVPDPGGTGASQLTLNDNVWAQEIRVDSFVNYANSSLTENVLNPYGCTGCWLGGGGSFPRVELTGGALGTLANFSSILQDGVADGGLIVHGQLSQAQSAASGVTLGSLYLLGGNTHFVGNFTQIRDVGGGYGLGVNGVYTLAVDAAGALGYQTSAAASFLGTPTLLINDLTTASSIAFSANVGTIHDGITVDVSHLDAAAGATGFGGAAFDVVSGGRIGLTVP